jgi:protein SCO1/2
MAGSAMNETAKPRFLLALLLPFALAAAACEGGGGEPPLKDARIGGAFTLTDQHGRRVGDRDFAGRWRIVYFGFSHCPDICPVDLALIGQALDRLEKSRPAAAARVQPIFITVDPERDTPAVLRPYVAAFHPRLTGLTGTPAEIAAVAKTFGIYHQKEAPRADGGYNVQHTRAVLLFGPEGEPVALLPHEQGAEAMAAELERWVK